MLSIHSKHPSIKLRSWRRECRHFQEALFEEHGFGVHVNVWTSDVKSKAEQSWGRLLGAGEAVSKEEPRQRTPETAG